ncbi:MAG TPA: AAA family ATPase [Lentisphaeria bacterium]|jgi:SpoVK/Ycf46/Vps4 family AAA+-type ATPase|nr:AAA family ATPase [Lentisphaeria bacterium]
MSEMMDQLQSTITGRSPLVYIYSPEEERIIRGIRELAAGESTPVRLWSSVMGLEGADAETTDPVKAILSIISQDLRGMIVLRDLAPFMSDPHVVRALREAYNDGRLKHDRVVFLLCADMNVPEALKKEVHLLEVAPPDESDIAAQIHALVAENPDYVIPEDVIRQVILALKGLTENEISYVLHRACRLKNADKDQLLDEIFAEKKNVVKKSGFLEFSPPRWRVDGIGGLDNLKDWLLKRQHMFTREALDAGVPIPKGLLMMGVSGCGKSLAVKTISSLWNIPMFRLDMNLVFSGMYGTPEEAFHRALKTIESVAPAVLWIDEIENALGLDESGDRIASHIFSSFLTWMQEKPPLIFIAATANKIQALPAEVLRKGRFDEVFFCDLPSKEEREDIMRIHLKANGANPDDFDFKMLQIMTEGWNGAEIEQAVISARTDAFYEKRPFNQRDLSNVIGRIVPLSDTMEQQIKAIRSWAFSRATPASKYGKSAAKRG